MKKFQRKKNIKQVVLNSKILFLFVLFLAFLSLRASANAYLTYKETEKRLLNIQKEYDLLEARSTAISKDLNYLNSQTGKEKEIRAKFDYAKEGEKAIFIIEEEVVIPESIPEKGFWQKTREFFGL